jgi:hypothetical protein
MKGLSSDAKYARVMEAMSLYLEEIKEYEIIDRYRITIDTLTESVLVTIWSCGVPMIQMIPIFNEPEDAFERARP